MFERFTAVARHVVVLSQEEARGLHHNYIGTEHILLGLLGEHEGTGFRVLESFGLTSEGVRQEIVDIIGRGQELKSGHLPFTPRAKKTLELALREALQLHHHHIGTEHILLGLIREGDGVAAQVMRKHADLLAIRAAVLDQAPAGAATESGPMRRWLRARLPGSGEPGQSGGPGAGTSGASSDDPGLSASPAADVTLTEASRLAGDRPVGSHHLLLAALADADSAAARALTALGVDLDQAKDALRDVTIEGTSDELPEDAGRRQLNIEVTGETVTFVATDPAIVKAAGEALKAIGGPVAGGEAAGSEAAGEETPDSQGGAPGSVIRGADLQGAAATSLATAWKSLHDALESIARTASVEAAKRAKGAAPEANPESGA